MVPKKNRLTGDTFPRSRPASSHTFSWGTVRYYPHRPYAVSVVAPKRIFPTSVIRNRVRRRLFEAIRHASRVRDFNAVALVFPARGATTHPFTALVKDFITLP